MDRQPEADLRELAARALDKAGVPAKVASDVVEVLIQADRRGVPSHGLFRLPSYIGRVKNGLTDAKAEPEIIVDAGGLVVFEGHNGLGAYAAMRATDLAMERARAHGTAWVTVRNTNHFGIASAYTLKLAQNGFIGLAISNAPAAMAAYGGKRAVLGTNPLSIALPAGEKPIVLDMATTLVAKGRVRRAAQNGETLPEGWALDTEGRPTTDAKVALKGTLMPAGGPKGYGLAVLIDALTGLVSGGEILTELTESTDMSKPAGISFTLIAADASKFPAGQDTARAEQFRTLIRASGDSDATILMPGEIEEGRAAEADAKGLPVSAQVIEELKKLAQ